MNSKIDQFKLMDYLYNELGEEERLEVEKYLIEHPEALKELEALQQTRGILSQLKPSVIQTPDKIDFSGVRQIKAEQGRQVIFTPGFTRWMSGIAASITLIFLMGYLTQFNVSYSNGNFSLAFGAQPPKESKLIVPENDSQLKAVPASLEKEDVQALIAAALLTEKDSLKKNLNQIRKQINKGQKPVIIKEKNNQVNQNTMNKELLAELKQELEGEFYENLNSLMEFYNAKLKEYTDNQLTDLAALMQEQRREDLRNIGVSLNTLEESQQKKQVRTDKILASLIQNASFKQEK